MNVSTSKTREQFPLHPKKIWKKTVTSLIVWIILLAVMFVPIFSFLLILRVDKYAGLAPVVGILFLFLAGILTYFYQRWYFAVYFYDLTSDFIVIRKGPITPHEITIPYERIQDIYMDQDIFDRVFGLYDVHLSSATITSGSAAHIDGLQKAAAEGLRGVLLETISRKIGKNKYGGVSSEMKPTPVSSPS